MLLCGRYKGVDERVIEHLAPLEISIGDFVLSGGELAAAVVVDAVTRLLPGALSDSRSAVEDSFTVHSDATVSAGGILDCPHYTRPADFRGRKVPGSPSQREPRRGEALAPPPSTGQDPAQPPRPAGTRGPSAMTTALCWKNWVNLEPDGKLRPSASPQTCCGDALWQSAPSPRAAPLPPPPSVAERRRC